MNTLHHVQMVVLISGGKNQVVRGTWADVESFCQNDIGYTWFNNQQRL